jgi:hypothetical protein
MCNRILFVIFMMAVGAHLTQGAILWAGQAQLSWNAPTTNANGTALTDLRLYRVHG